MDKNDTQGNNFVADDEDFSQRGINDPLSKKDTDNQLYIPKKITIIDNNE